VLTATVDDSVTGTGANQWDYGSSGWFFYKGNDISSAYQSDEHYAFTTSVVAHFRFNGTQVKIFTLKEPADGFIGYTLDPGSGGTEQTVSNYSPSIAGNSLSFTSLVLAPGNHDLLIRVVGSHPAGATSNTITMDKAEVYTTANASPTATPVPSPTPTPRIPVLAATVNDSVTGTGNNQWDYGSSGWSYYAGSKISAAYQSDEHYAFATNVGAHFRFNGTQVKIYTVKEPVGGYIGYTLDPGSGGTEQVISNYSPAIVPNSPSFTSPVAAAGNHDLVIRVLGSHEGNSTSNTITVDKAEVYTTSN
jgi:hypothetical protein